MIVPPEKRPLLVGLVFALIGLGLVLRWPPDKSGDIAWAVPLGSAGACIVVYERWRRRLQRPSALLRWTGVAIGVVAIVMVICSSFPR